MLGDKYEKEVDEIYNDFNKAIKDKGSFIKEHMDTLYKDITKKDRCWNEIVIKDVHDDIEKK
eukprot:CAMPEP_0176389460 /NCGR_PEP_ID=MMETSP0126-20121128/38398_1 /TAXON_ID=141414 ORGANISM="Strombidinopsis acuminatum, Strain SPMC142" /NCGR_SAMPLE_ID=MMETSP0126 /ASSEMBLY_ACC=CAM_ASM_000229 /LENGTH=61 /DNA_ID=CAMNT_0017758295 /DNA_START=112 /DNA_END=293 /DNA_ORIENTATION=+